MRKSVSPAVDLLRTGHERATRSAMQQGMQEAVSQAVYSGLA
jgi:hypothetical protein